MTSMLKYFISTKLFMWLVIAFLSIGSIVGISNLRREAYPRVEFHEARITTIFYGASPVDVEQRVTIPIEKELREVEGLKQVRSISRESVSEISVQVDLSETDPDGVLEDVRRAVRRVNDLPSQVTDRPVFQEQKTGMFPILEISVFGVKGEHNLRERAVFLEEELERLAGVARVDIFGERDREWQILVNPGRLRSHGIDLNAVGRALAGRNVNVPGGSVGHASAQNIRTNGEFRDIKELGYLPIQSNDTGYMVRLGKVAKFKDTYERPTLLARTNGQRAINLQVIKKERADILATVEAVKKRIAELQGAGPVKFQIVNDTSRQTRRQLDVVFSNAVIGLILVVAILMLFLNIRMAVLTSISLPLVVLGTLLFFPIYDITLNMVSMMGMIIALGMLVDNSIVISENVYRYREEGLGPIDAAVKGASEMMLPIIGSFLTTIAAFLPMMFMSGSMGKFIWQIPFVVIVVLTVSLLESFFLLPARMAHYGGVPDSRIHRVRAWINRGFGALNSGFGRLSDVVIRRPFITLSVVALVFMAAFFGLTQMRFTLFPKEEVEVFLIKAEFEPSTRVTETMRRMGYVEELVRALPAEELVSYSMKGGVQQRDVADPLQRVGEHLGMIQVFLTPEVSRKRKASEIIADLDPKIRKMKGLKHLHIEELVPSPPIGAAVTAAVEGKDYATLRKISGELRAYLASLDGVYNINDDYKPGREELLVRVDPAKAAMVGIDTALVARMVRTAFEGEPVTTIRRGREEITLRVLYDGPYRGKANMLGGIRVPNRVGLQTPLGTISSIKKRTGPESLSHYDFERAVTITADVRENKTTSNVVNAKLLAHFDKLKSKYPGYRLALRGEQEETAESMASLGRAGILAMLAIFAILAVLFRDARYPFLILSTIPLGIIGIVVGFLISNKAMSFLAMIGMIGLAGVQVNAAIMLVTQIRRLRSEGLSLKESLAGAARLRFRPILITTLTTMGGLFPTAYSLGGSDPVLIPMTLALAWGLGFGTLGSLIYVPAVLSALDNVRERVRKVLNKKRRGLRGAAEEARGISGNGHKPPEQASTASAAMNDGYNADDFEKDYERAYARAEEKS